VEVVFLYSGSVFLCGGGVFGATRHPRLCRHPVDVVVPGLNGGGKAEAAVTAGACFWHF
jgi:hypothetical protein